jgi:dihydroorotase-like cyclic amidohydrolase
MALTRYPGLIDIHVHLRDPGATYKEDFHTGTRAAIKGGFTYIVDMPNNPSSPTVTIIRLEEKIQRAKKNSVCDIGFHYGTDGYNLDSFLSASKNSHVFGLKIYCNETTGDLLINDEKILESIFASWQSDKPILVHAEKEMISLCIDLARYYSRRLHICHVSTKDAVRIVQKAKQRKELVTAGVTPHHLFLTSDDLQKLGNYAFVKPQIGNEEDRLSLWEAIERGCIDLIESDHAPHTREDKMRGAPASGVPGLETTLGLLLRAKIAKKLTREQIVDFLYTNPKRIFSIPDQKDTYIELNEQKSYVVGEYGYETKCGWSPFDGWELFGEVETVMVRGIPLVQKGLIV